MLISICIPCYKSEKTIGQVVHNIIQEFSGLEYDYEVVLANDGSPDHTFDVIKILCAENEKIHGIELSRNYGQVYAKMAALKYAKGDIVIFMDDDGQHPVSGIPMLIDKILEGYDIVYAHFSKKTHNFFRRIASDMHNKLAEHMGNKPKNVHRSSYCAWSRTVADAALRYKSPFMSLGSYLMHITTRYAEVSMEQNERLAGQSGYTLKKLFRMWINLFFGLTMAPLRMITYSGGFCAIAGLITMIVLIIVRACGANIGADYISLLTVIIVLAGVILLAIGIMGEYLGRIYMTISNLPQYNIREIVNLTDEDQ